MMAMQVRVTVYQQYQGAKRVQCSGELQINMDLSAAFDMAHNALDCDVLT